MRKVLLFIMLCVCMFCQAQQLSVKSVRLHPQDARARTNPREDTKGNKCAIVRVGVVGVEDLVFPDAVGEVEYKLNEYVVYVSGGLKKFRYKDKTGHVEGTIDFDEWGLDETTSQATYSVELETESHLRAAIFTNIPHNAHLYFDNQRVEVDKDGTAVVYKSVGEYPYHVKADGYWAEAGTVSLKEDDISTTTVVAMAERKYKVSLKVYPDNATLFVDNIPYTQSTLEMELTEGKHTIRATAPYYEEEEHTIDVKKNGAEYIINLKEAKHQIVEHKEERSRTSINVRNCGYINVGAAMMGCSEIDKIIDKGNALDINIEGSYVAHFAGIMGLRIGAGIGFINSDENEKYLGLSYNSESDSLEWLMHIDVPLQIGFSIPFGKYNQHMFNVFGGGYGSYMWQSGLDYKLVEPNSDLQKRIEAHEEKDEDSKLDYGIRLSAKLDLGRFVIGADLSQSLNGMVFSAGVNLGLKIFKKKKYY